MFIYFVGGTCPSDGKYACVTAFNGNAVAVIDTTTLKVVKMIPVGGEPWGLLFLSGAVGTLGRTGVNK